MFFSDACERRDSLFCFFPHCMGRRWGQVRLAFGFATVWTGTPLARPRGAEVGHQVFPDDRLEWSGDRFRRKPKSFFDLQGRSLVPGWKVRPGGAARMPRPKAAMIEHGSSIIEAAVPYPQWRPIQCVPPE